MIRIVVEAILALVATLSAPVETEVMIEAPVIEAPVSTLQMDHEANGCRIGWLCAEGVDVVATEACLTAEHGPEFPDCVWFASTDGNGLGDSFVIHNGDPWPIHVFEGGSYVVTIVPCGGDADCIEKNPMIATHAGY